MNQRKYDAKSKQDNELGYFKNAETKKQVVKLQILSTTQWHNKPPKNYTKWNKINIMRFDYYKAKICKNAQLNSTQEHNATKVIQCIIW